MLIQLLSAMMWSGVALAGTPAAIPTGYFDGNFLDAQYSDTARAQVWIRTHRDGEGFDTTYAVVTCGADKEQRAALFLVESVDRTQMAFVHLYQDGKRGLATPANHDPSYSVTIAREDNDVELHLVPTAFGKTLGCTEEAKVELESSGPQWIDFPAEKMDFEGEADSKLTIQDKTFSGRIVLGGRSITGQFRLEPLIPGLGVLGMVSVSSTSDGGRAEAPSFEGVVIMIEHDPTIGFDSPGFRFVELKVNTLSCFNDHCEMEKD